MSAVRLQRTLAAPPARVYRAWLDPAVMVRWFAPAGFTVARAEADARVGGRIAVWHRDDEGPVGGVLGQLVELVPERRIVARLWFTDPDEPLDPVQETRLTLTFEPAGTGTLLTLVHDRLDGLAGVRPEVADGVRRGWDSALDTLAHTLERSPDSPDSPDSRDTPTDPEDPPVDIAETLAAAAAQDLWNRAPLMRLAYTGADGSPRVVPLGYLVRGTTILTWTIPTSVKVRSLRADPRVALTVDVGGIPPCALLVRGTAQVTDVDGIPEGYLEASRRTMDAATYAQWEPGVRALYDSMTEIAVTPTWASLLDFTTTLPQEVARLARAKGLA